MVALRSGVDARNRRQIRSSIADRLNTGLLIIGEDDDFNRVIAVRGGRAPHLDLAVNAKHFGHFWLELGVAPLRVIADLVRLDLMCCQNLTHCSLGEFRQLGWPACGPWLRACAANRRVVPSSWDATGLAQARETSHALASRVITASR